MNKIRALKIGDVSVAAGERGFGSLGYVELADGTQVRIPLMIVRGLKRGPSLLLLSTIHGPEILGIEVIRRIIREEVNPKRLVGSILAIPVANPLAFQNASYVTPYFDYFDLNRSFPGDSQGTITVRMADMIWSAVSKSDYIIDIHGVPNAMGHGYTVVRLSGKDSVDKNAIDMARAYGLSIVISEQRRIEEKGRLPGLQALAMHNGIPCILVETSGWRVWSRTAADSGVRGVLNVMKTLGMIPGSVEKQEGFVCPKPLKTHMLFANKGGILHLMKSPGEQIAAGDTVARILNIYGDEVETIKSPKAGYVCAYPFMENQAVAAGEYVALIGEIIENYKI